MNVLIEDNVAIAASDAGIYVGQSEQIIVRGNRAEYNVAGIEVENSIGADVYNNTAIANTGGILVFNMPGIPKRGYGTRVFDNDIKDNNTANFAAGALQYPVYLRAQVSWSTPMIRWRFSTTGSAATTLLIF